MRTIIVLLILISTNAIADSYHYKNLLTGTKAMGLGGAFHGISDDLSAVFFNPAGLVDAEKSNSASLSTFAWESTKYKEVFSTGADISRSSFTIVPSFLGLGGEKDSWNWSLAFSVPDMSSERTFSSAEYPIFSPEQIKLADVTEYANIDIDNSEYKLGFGAARHLSDNISFGFSLTAKYKQFISDQGSGISTLAYLPQQLFSSGFRANRRIKDENIILAPSLGMLIKNPVVNLGLTLSKDYVLKRDYTASHSIVVSPSQPIPPGALTSAVGTIYGEDKQEFATKFAIGAAKRVEKWQFSFDVEHYTGVDSKSIIINPAHPPITRSLEAVNNFALGISYQFDNDHEYSLGIFTDKSNIQVEPDEPFQRAEIVDMKGISFAMKTMIFSYPFTIGAYYKWGDGQVRVSDIRVVENLVGYPLYPQTNELDVSNASKKQFVTYVSANF